MNHTYDHIILGAGIYGLYIARRLALKFPDRRVAVLEYDPAPFQRASYINQARIHNGYHYPRSLSTASKTAEYYARFNKDFHFAVNRRFQKIYAVSKAFSYASGDNFQKFCDAVGIPCQEIHASQYFKPHLIDRCFLAEEFALDAKTIRDYFISELDRLKNATIQYNVRIQHVEHPQNQYRMILKNGNAVQSPFIINSTYASVNQVLNLFGFDPFEIKYEIAEICLCTVSAPIKTAGLTVMDGPFFSVMPFGLSGYHSLSSVHFTPHKTSYAVLPEFTCQQRNPGCTPFSLENCNTCAAKPKTAWDEMHQLSKKYLIDSIQMDYKESLFAIKPILKASEVSDSRPTIIKTFSENPTFISVLSGKFNTMYDLDEVL
jgi:hypothetical protein